jgi:hypothetical protein
MSLRARRAPEGLETSRKSRAVSAAPPYSSAAVVAGPSPRPARSIQGVVAPKRRAAATASRTPRERAEERTGRTSPRISAEAPRGDPARPGATNGASTQ